MDAAEGVEVGAQHAAPLPTEGETATSDPAVAEARTILGAMAARRISLRDDICALDESQWKWLVKRRLTKIDNFSDLIRVFHRHQPGIAALDGRLMATDRLIDRIVYRLYGLTNDEIAIVEGTAANAGDM
jgi:hypothetical protein